MYKKRKNTNKKGFSLLEVLTALFVLSVGVVGISVLMTGNMKNSIDAKNQIIADQLVQEGQELIRNIFDNTSLSTPYANLVKDGTAEVYNCRIDYIKAWDMSSNTSCEDLGITDNDNNFFTLYQKGNFFVHDNTGDKTKFSRRVAIMMQDSSGDAVSSVASAYRIRVRVIVTWDDSYKNVSIGECTIANKCEYIDSILTK